MSQSSGNPGRSSTRVFLDELPWDIRSKNTDWRYVRFVLPKLSAFESSLEFTMQTSRWLTVRENGKILRAALGRRIGWPMSRHRELISSLSLPDLAASAANIVFSHRAFPVNAGSHPVVWQNCVLDPEMQLAYGASPADVADEISLKGALYRRCAAVQVSTEAEAERMCRTFPDIAGRFAAVPFFTPHATACDLVQLEKQHQAGPVRILFTGNHVRRKGLDLLLEAFLSLPAAVQETAEMTVISNFVGPSISLPQHPRIAVLRGVDSSRVIAEMARSHIFVNVARFESYGLVFHEAMSQGLVCLAPEWEVQRELFEGGRAGMLLPCSAEAISKNLEELIAKPELRYRLGLAAWNRFNERYAPAVVARKYANLFHRVARESSPSS